MPKTQDLIIGSMGAVMSVLFAGNVFFLSRLVDKIEKIEETTWSLRQQILVLELTFKNKGG